MQPLPGLALVWVGKSQEFSCSCVFKELQNALHHLSALWFPQICEVCVCLPESYNYLWESNPQRQAEEKKKPTGHVNPSMVSSSPARRSPRTEALLIHMSQMSKLAELLGCLLWFLPSSAVCSSVCRESRGEGAARSRKQPQRWKS